MAVTQHAIDKRALAFGRVQNTERQFMPVLVDSQGRIILSGVPSGGALESTSQTILSYLGTPVSTDLTIIKNKTNLIPADISTQLDTNIPAILAKVGLLNGITGTFTTSSATVPADTSRTEGANYWKDATIVPISGAAAWQKRRIKSFASGVFTLYQGFDSAPGLVGYILIPDRNRAYYETYTYAPGLQDTGDLESSTKTISATSEPGTADYTSSLTLPIPTDSRLQIVRIGTRSSIVSDSLNAGCTSLRCRIYVDTQDANHLLHDITIASATTTLTTQDLLTGTKDTIYALLKDGNAHSFKFFFWVNSGNAVISLVELFEGVGNTGASNTTAILKLVFMGLVTAGFDLRRNGSAGSGGCGMYVDTNSSFGARLYGSYSSGLAGSGYQTNCAGIVMQGNLYLNGYAATGDLVYINSFMCSIRSDT
jgi:hypothetical protein